MDEKAIKQAMKVATPDEKRRITEMLGELKRRELREKAQNDFLSFVRFIWPDFIDGAHHKRMGNIFESVAKGERKRVIINLAPRHTKSEFASYLLPAWLLGKFPKKQIMQVSNTSELAEGFGRKVRNLVGSEEFREIFPDVDLRQDSKAAGRWNTNHGGSYFATGVGGALAGRGADYCLAPSSLVYCSKRGAIKAKHIRIGDKILGSDGYGEVLAVITSKHTSTINIDGAEFSKQHPIWTVNRGWVEASELTTLDYLQTVSWYDRLSALIKKGDVYATSNKRTQIKRKILFTHIFYMVRDAAALLKSKCSQLQYLWGSWNKSLCEVGTVRQLCRGYGRTPDNESHIRQDRYRRGLHAENCRWANNEQQSNNRRNNVQITAYGQTMTLAQWVRKTGLSRDMIKHRIFSMGLPPEEALEMPRGSWVQKKVNQYSLTGELVGQYASLADMEKVTGFSKKAVHRCLTGRSHTSLGFVWEYEDLPQ